MLFFVLPVELSVKSMTSAKSVTGLFGLDFFGGGIGDVLIAGRLDVELRFGMGIALPCRSVRLEKSFGSDRSISASGCTGSLWYPSDPDVYGKVPGAVFVGGVVNFPLVFTVVGGAGTKLVETLCALFLSLFGSDRFVE